MSTGPRPDCVAVAYSGGRDSSALLHATLAAAGPLGVRVAALHVHHGLNANADDWLSHCAAQCDRWARRRAKSLTFASARATGSPAPGESIEAWARTVRYRALRELADAQGTSVILLAHHRRDQAETFLLQALRGAGAAGLAGMPARVERAGITWMRPWLGRPREQIDAYVTRHRIKCIEDDSNEDPRYARNRLRLEVWSALTGAFPHAEASLADSAQRAQEALECLTELAEQDMASVAAHSNALDVKAWLALSPARRSNVLRAWLKQAAGRAAPASLVTRLMAELRLGGSARWPIENSEVRLYRGVLRFGETTGAGFRPTTEQRPEPHESSLSVDGPGAFDLPGWGGCLHVARTRERGVPLAWLGRLDLKPRSGAERFQGGIGRPPRSLKKQYQDQCVPAWERKGPLFYSGGQLVFVPGLGLDARVLALPDQEQMELHWQPRTPDAALDGGVLKRGS
ncbi:MAG: tRNA(Ile)-lysidine synthase [Methylibium sp. NZG]|nr:MAG: tRNA(Ile)-lysidine synthase [Methylibium sp. NZG]